MSDSRNSRANMTPVNPRMQLSRKIFAFCGFWLVALGAYFIFLRPALLQEDPRFMGSSLEAIRLAVPGLEQWLGHVFNVMGGFMVAAGLMTTLVACRLYARSDIITFIALLATGAVSVGLMSVTNFILNSNFRWILVVPVFLWLMGLVCYWRERVTCDAPKA